MLNTLLAIRWDVDPNLFGLRIFHWYSWLFIAGFILGWYIIRWMFRREGVSEKLMDPLLYTMLIGTIVGARLGHCIFYQPEYYFGSWHGFWEIFMPWKGGLASHGGTIALIFAVWWYAHHYGPKNGFDFFWIADRLVITICFAGAFIRLGNLFNSEIYGGPTDLPWGFIFVRNHEVVPKHPTQLYEAFSYIILGLMLVWLYVKKGQVIKRGTIFGWFFIVLFGVRFLIEFVKNDQGEFDQKVIEMCGLNLGQLLSIPFILIGIGLLVWLGTGHGKPWAVDKVEPLKAQKKEKTHYAKSLSDS